MSGRSSAGPDSTFCTTTTADFSDGQPQHRTQRRPITLDGTGLEVRFIKRRVGELDADLTTTVLGDVLVTSIEQSILDLAHPRVSEVQALAEREAIESLTPRADHVALKELAARQRLGRALRRAQRVSPALRDDTEWQPQ